LKRRDFITLLGGAAAWPLAARAQQPKMPVIGLLNGASFDAFSDRVAAIRRGLRDTGFVEGQNVTIEYRSADGQYDRLPGLAADLVRRQVAVIVSIGATASPQAAKAATSNIPIVFATGGDALVTGIVKNFSRPEANVTGLSFNQTGLVPKRVELMRELLPASTVVAYLANPSNRNDINVDELKAAARTLGIQIVLLDATTKQEIDSAFVSIARQRAAALVLSSDASFNAYRDQIIALAARNGIPTQYSNRAYVDAGGLMSYGAEPNDLYHQVGVYTGRILKGEKPGDLPVMQPTKFEMVINLKTAKALGLTVPPNLLATADEVIE
jgi:putative ABC transport system substrate-binding protein